VPSPPSTLFPYTTLFRSCFISHGAMFINDLFVEGCPAPNRDLWRPTKLGNHVSIGTNATVLPVTICDQVVIGAGAVVTKDITERSEEHTSELQSRSDLVC